VEYVADGAGLGEQAQREAVAVLADVQDWSMSESGWERVGEAVESLASAVAHGGEPALRAATIALELLSPARVGKIGDPSKKPPPKRLLARTTYLLDTLDTEKRQVDRATGSARDQKDDRKGK